MLPLSLAGHYFHSQMYGECTGNMLENRLGTWGIFWEEIVMLENRLGTWGIFWEEIDKLENSLEVGTATWHALGRRNKSS